MGSLGGPELFYELIFSVVCWWPTIQLINYFPTIYLLPSHLIPWNTNKGERGIAAKAMYAFEACLIISAGALRPEIEDNYSS